MSSIVYPTWITIPTNTWNTVIPSPPDPQFTGIDLAPEPEKKKHCDGCTCRKCKEFYPYAEPNQDDGTLVCYACRHGL